MTSAVENEFFPPISARFAPVKNETEQPDGAGRTFERKIPFDRSEKRLYYYFWSFIFFIRVKEPDEEKSDGGRKQAGGRNCCRPE